MSSANHKPGASRPSRVIWLLENLATLIILPFAILGYVFYQAWCGPQSSQLDSNTDYAWRVSRWLAAAVVTMGLLTAISFATGGLFPAILGMSMTTTTLVWSAASGLALASFLGLLDIVQDSASKLTQHYCRWLLPALLLIPLAILSAGLVPASIVGGAASTSLLSSLCHSLATLGISQLWAQLCITATAMSVILAIIHGLGTCAHATSIALQPQHPIACKLMCVLSYVLHLFSFATICQAAAPLATAPLAVVTLATSKRQTHPAPAPKLSDSQSEESPESAREVLAEIQGASEKESPESATEALAEIQGASKDETKTTYSRYDLSKNGLPIQPVHIIKLTNNGSGYCITIPEGNPCYRADQNIYFHHDDHQGRTLKLHPLYTQASEAILGVYTKQNENDHGQHTYHYSIVVDLKTNHLYLVEYTSCSMILIPAHSSNPFCVEEHTVAAPRTMHQHDTYSRENVYQVTQLIDPKRNESIAYEQTPIPTLLHPACNTDHQHLENEEKGQKIYVDPLTGDYFTRFDDQNAENPHFTKMRSRPTQHDVLSSTIVTAFLRNNRYHAQSIHPCQQCQYDPSETYFFTTTGAEAQTHKLHTLRDEYGLPIWIKAQNAHPISPFLPVHYDPTHHQLYAASVAPNGCITYLPINDLLKSTCLIHMNDALRALPYYYLPKPSLRLKDTDTDIDLHLLLDCQHQILSEKSENPTSTADSYIDPTTKKIYVIMTDDTGNLIASQLHTLSSAPGAVLPLTAWNAEENAYYLPNHGTVLESGTYIYPLVEQTKNEVKVLDTYINPLDGCVYSQQDQAENKEPHTVLPLIPFSSQPMGLRGYYTPLPTRRMIIKSSHITVLLHTIYDEYLDPIMATGTSTDDQKISAQYYFEPTRNILLPITHTSAGDLLIAYEEWALQADAHTYPKPLKMKQELDIVNKAWNQPPTTPTEITQLAEPTWVGEELSTLDQMLTSIADKRNPRTLYYDEGTTPPNKPRGITIYQVVRLNDEGQPIAVSDHEFEYTQQISELWYNPSAKDNEPMFYARIPDLNMWMVCTNTIAKGLNLPLKAWSDNHVTEEKHDRRVSVKRSY